MRWLGGIIGSGSGASASGTTATAASALWTFPSIIGSAVLIAWAAEAAQFLISQGMALAILAWLQTLPEFAVEAVIAYEAPRIPNGVALISANFTGSLRLLVGLGWPMIYAVAAFFHRRKYGRPLREIHLEGEHAVETLALLPPLLYFTAIWAKGTLTVVDAAILSTLYFTYLWILNKIPPQDVEKMEDAEMVPRKILGLKPALRNATIVALFLAGGTILYFVAHPFLHSMLALAVSLGFSQYVFVQWVAPFLSEFPEKVSAFYWARKITGAPMALMNMVSSNINQWTMLAAMIPIVYSYSLGGVSPVVFDEHQRLEILLTISQSALGFILLCNMSFAWYEAAGLFSLWFVQFAVPWTHWHVTGLYFGWCLLEMALFAAGRRTFKAFPTFAALFRTHVAKARGGTRV